MGKYTFKELKEILPFKLMSVRVNDFLLKGVTRRRMELCIGNEKNIFNNNKIIYNIQ